MEHQLFLNGGVLHFDPQSTPTWQSLSSSPMDANCSSENTHNCFYSNGLHFDSSAPSSMVSSPAASNSNDNFAVRELIGKFGNISGGDEISLRSPALIAASSYINGGNSTNSSCHSTPTSSPPKVNKPMALNSAGAVAEFGADPAFSERTAKFSCFQSRSFNGRSSQFGTNDADVAFRRSRPVTMENCKLPRVSSSPSLKVLIGSHQKEVTTISQEESTISDIGVSPCRRRKASSSPASKGKAKVTCSTPANPPMGAEGGKEDSNGGRGNENGTVKAEEESKEGTSNKKQNKTDKKSAEPPKDYIRVRARRGQATDSHSLAERVRREKISERMKLLQDLVPSCNKVTGKALMLDEIINYVQSLQRQVEFLSMKLASVNTGLDFNIESLISKDIFQSNNSLAHPIFQLDSSSQTYYGQQHLPQNSAIHNNNIPSGTVTHTTVDRLDTIGLCQNLFGMELPHLNGFNNNNNNDGDSQYPMTFSDDDLHAIVQMGFGPIANSKTPFQSQGINDSNQVPF